jgi:hypothetical protein
VRGFVQETNRVLHAAIPLPRYLRQECIVEGRVEVLERAFLLLTQAIIASKHGIENIASVAGAVRNLKTAAGNRFPDFAGSHNLTTDHNSNLFAAMIEGEFFEGQNLVLRELE